MAYNRSISMKLFLIIILVGFSALPERLHAMQGVAKKLALVAAVASATDLIMAKPQVEVVGLQGQSVYSITVSEANDYCENDFGNLLQSWSAVNVYNQCTDNDYEQGFDLSQEVVFQEVRQRTPEEQKKLNDDLLKAIDACSVKSISRLLQAGADAELKDGFGYPVIHHAMIWGGGYIHEGFKMSINKAENFAYVSNANELHFNNIESTALMAASDLGNVDQVKALLISGAEIDAQNYAGETALMRAIRARHGGFEVIDTLIASGAQLDVKDMVGRSALMHGVMLDNVEAVKLLIRAGALVDTEDVLCAFGGDSNRRMVAILALAKVKQTAQFYAFTENGDLGWLPKFFMMLSGKLSGDCFMFVISKYFKNQEIRKMILAGIRPDVADAIGSTPWSRANQAERAIMKLAQRERIQHQLAVVLAGKNPTLLGEGLELSEDVLDCIVAFANTPKSEQDTKRLMREKIFKNRTEYGWYADDSALACCASYPDCACAH